VERRTEPCGDTSFNEGKEEDETKDNGVSSLDVGFLVVSVCFVADFGVEGGVFDGRRRVASMIQLLGMATAPEKDMTLV
jgi:hypothetical protein